MKQRSRLDERAAIVKRTEDYTELIKKFTNPELTEIGNYKIIKEIGHGAFGQIFLAYHKLLRVKVVLKKGLKTLDSDNLMREYYSLREFRNHPHIAKIYEIIITETHAYMVLEYYPNGDLFEYVTARRKLSIDESLYFFTQICGAVYYIHSNNCCHRDLKLENILLDKNLNIKLSDLGFTREIPYSFNQRTKPLLNEFCGTTAYMAPEIINRQPYSGIKIDIWALGIMLYTMITGVMPFNDSLPDEQLEKLILETEPYYDSSIISKTELIILLQTMLLKNPEDRPNSLETILELPLLAPYGGEAQLSMVEKVMKETSNGATKTFSSSERQLIKDLKNVGIDKELLIKSIENQHLDSVVGFWELLKEKKKKSLRKKLKQRSKSMLRLNSSKSFMDSKSVTKAPILKSNPSVFSSIPIPQPQQQQQQHLSKSTPPSTPHIPPAQRQETPRQQHHSSQQPPQHHQSRILRTPSSTEHRNSVATSIDQPLEIRVNNPRPNYDLASLDENDTTNGHTRAVSDELSIRFPPSIQDRRILQAEAKQFTQRNLTSPVPDVKRKTSIGSLKSSNTIQGLIHPVSSFSANGSSSRSSTADQTTKESKRKNRLSIKYIVSKLTKNKKLEDDSSASSNKSTSTQSTIGRQHHKNGNSSLSKEKMTSSTGTLSLTPSRIRSNLVPGKSSDNSLTNLDDAIKEGTLSHNNLKSDMVSLNKVNSGNTVSTTTKTSIFVIEPTAATATHQATNNNNHISNTNAGMNGGGASTSNGGGVNTNNTEYGSNSNNSTPSQLFPQDLNYNSISRHNSSGKKITRPGSVISSYSIQTTISETSNGSGYVTGYSTDYNNSISQNPYYQSVPASNSNVMANGTSPTSVANGSVPVKRPSFNRARSSELSISIQNSSSQNLPDSPSSSFTTLSRSGSVDSASFNIRGRRKKRGGSSGSSASGKASTRIGYDSVSPKDFLRRGKSPLAMNRLNTKWYKDSPLSRNNKGSKRKQQSTIQEESDLEEPIMMTGGQTSNGNNGHGSLIEGDEDVPADSLQKMTSAVTGLGIKEHGEFDEFAEGDDEREDFEEELLDDEDDDIDDDEDEEEEDEDEDDEDVVYGGGYNNRSRGRRSSSFEHTEIGMNRAFDQSSLINRLKSVALTDSESINN